jgi:hypothetical protein
MSMRSWLNKKWIIFLAILNVAIHLLVFNHLEYHRDELLYFSLCNHPAFGYASVPPLTGWMAWIMKTLLGYHLFAVKLLPALFSGVYVVLCSVLAESLGGKSYAQVLAAIGSIFTPFSLRVFHLYEPVFFDLFFWTLVYYVIILYMNTEKDKYLIRLGIVFGLAVLNKYLIMLLLPALFIPFLLTSWRKVFLNKALYIGIALALLIVLPNILWQMSHHFPVFRHMSELSSNQLVHVNSLDFFKDLLLMPFAVWILIFPGIILLIRDSRYRPIGISTVIVIVALVLLRGKGYYALGVIPVWFAAGAVYWEGVLNKIWARIALPVLIISLTIPIIPLGLPVFHQNRLIHYFDTLDKKYGLTLGRRFEDGSIHSLPQDYADQLGWEELTKITAEAYRQIPDKSKAMIYAENYGQAGAISVIGKQYGLPEPVSFSDSYRYWVPRHFDPDIEYFIYINDDLGEDVQAAFSDIKIAGSISNKDAREYNTKVYLCTAPVRSFNLLWQDALQRVKIDE